jgi:hypothetical protein
MTHRPLVIINNQYGYNLIIFFIWKMYRIYIRYTLWWTFSLFNYYIYWSCIQFSGYTLTTSSDSATVGLDFTFTCVTTKSLVIFNRNEATVCTIIGRNTDGTCILEHGYTPDYTYTCNPTIDTYTVTIPGSYLDNVHGTRWKCQNPFGRGESNIKILYVNGELLYHI